MIEPILGSKNAERVLIFIFAKEKGYAREITRFFNTNLYGIQKQLDRLEAGGVLVSEPAGRTRLYMLNPRYPFLNELKALLEKALSFYPQKDQESLLFDRRKPQRKGKDL